jgi:hypothetical protein
VETARGRPLRHKLHTDQQPAAANLADVRILVQPRPESGQQPLALGRARGNEVFGLEDPEDLRRDRGGDRTVRVGEAMDERRGPARGESCVDLV